MGSIFLAACSSADAGREAVREMAATTPARGEAHIVEEGRICVGFQRFADELLYGERGDLICVLSGTLAWSEMSPESLKGGDGDIQSLLEAWSSLDIECLRYLRQPFCALFANRHSGRVVLANHFSGVKPLYYRVNADEVLIASEVRQIARAMKARPRLAAGADYDWLGLKGSSSGTVVDGINALVPGQAVSIDALRHRIEEIHPPSFPESPDTTNVRGRRGAIDYERLSREVMHRFRRSVQSATAGRTVSAALSSGRDSTLAVAVAASLSREGKSDLLEAVTLGARGTDADESILAARTAGALGVAHHGISIRTDQRYQISRRVHQILDEPSRSGIGWQCLVLERVRRNQCRFLICGELGDYLFGFHRNHLLSGSWVQRMQRWWRMLKELTRRNASLRDRVLRGLIGALPVDRFLELELVGNIRVLENFRSMREDAEIPAVLRATSERAPFRMHDQLCGGYGVERLFPYADSDLWLYLGDFSRADLCYRGEDRYLQNRLIRHFLDNRYTSELGKVPARGFEDPIHGDAPMPIQHFVVQASRPSHRRQRILR